MNYNGPTPSIFERKDKYSFLNDPSFKFGSSYSHANPSEISAPSPTANPAAGNSLFSDPVGKAVAQGAASGGLSGALTSGGVASMLGPSGMAGGGPWAAAGGLILSQIEAAKKLEAQKEQERVENEKARRNNQMSLYNNMSQTQFRV